MNYVQNDLTSEACSTRSVIIHGLETGLGCSFHGGVWFFLGGAAPASLSALLSSTH